MIKEIAYAKINLALEVMDLVDGYHKVNNIMIPISIYDELELSISDDVYVVDNQINDNICVKAAKLFLERFNINNGVCIKLKKNIPLMAGLAGGSTDAAAVLKGLNKLYNVNASNDELKNLASNLGSDVPFFIDTKIALCTNRGEVINPLDINTPNINVLLIKPQIGLSTKEVYQKYIYEGISKKDNIENIIKALNSNDLELLKNNIFNDLALPALSLSNDLNNIYSKIKNEDINIYISGSGPTMYVLNPTDKEIEKIKEIVDDSVYIKLCHTF